MNIKVLRFCDDCGGMRMFTGWGFFTDFPVTLQDAYGHVLQVEPRAATD